MKRWREKMEDNQKEVGKSSKRKGSLRTVFVHADAADIWLMCLGTIGAIGDGLALPALFYVNSRVLNNFGAASAGNDDSQFVHSINDNVLTLTYLACASFVLAFFEGYCWARTGERQATRMRAKYLKAVLRQDVAYFDLNEGSMTDAITSVSDDILLIQDFLSEKIQRMIANISSLVGCYVVAFTLLWRLAIVGIPFLLLLIVPGFVFGRIMMSLATEIRTEYNKAGTIVQQAISSIRTVYSFVGENKIMSEFSESLQGSVKLGLKQGFFKGCTIGSNNMMITIWAFMAWYGSTLVMYHHAQGGTVFVVGMTVLFGGMSLGSALMNIKYFSEATITAERIMDTIRRTPGIDSENMEGQILETVSGEVEFRNIKFAYPSRPDNIIFKDFCLKIPVGRTVALVGGSGSGKSTVISLLERFYDPHSGEILLDGVAINKLQLKWFRSQMGLVSQEPALFATSVKENIIFGKEDATMDEIIAAAKSANAHNFVSQLPQGYDTQVGEAGIQISGGQKQRLAIARAIIKAPKILLLDEATSALDSESERIVQEALDKVMVGRTTVVIAHRLSTIRNADMIAVVHNGQVMETGTHEELMQDENGLYTALVRNQERETKGKDDTHLVSTSMSLHLSREDSHNGSSRRRSSMSINRSISTKSKVGTEGIIEVDEVVKEEFHVPSFRRLLLLNLPEWKNAAFGCTCAALYGAVQPIQTFMMGSMISVYFLTDHNEIKSKTRAYSLGFAGLGVFSVFVNIIQHYNFAAMGECMTQRIRERMLSKILTFEVAWFDQESNSTGAVCSRLAKDANTVRSLVGDRMCLLLQSLSSVIVCCSVGLIISWRLSLVLIAIQPLLVVSHYIRRVLLQHMTKKALKIQEESSKLAAEAVSNHRTITIFSSQDRILRLLAEAEEGPRRESIRQSWYAGILLGTSQSMLYFTRAFEFWYGGQLLSKGEVTSKNFLEAFFVVVSLGRVIADAGSMTSDLSKGTQAVASVFAVLDRETRIEPEDPQGYQPDKLTGRVELRDVEFAYPARPNIMIFKGFSINVRPGKSTALVGHSGSGKSTIISLIDRFYDPLKGTVEIDGRDIKTYNLKALRKHIALVSQEPTLFAKTIRENILFGISDAVDEAEIVAAARAANAHDFITALKDGYDTFCGDKGTQLSGGQKQRIAIARAILKNPVILLLDEATSALDTQSEKVVQEALERLMVGRTSVVVAHRLSTIQNCDTIAVLDKGKVVEKGTHSSLLANGPTGAYYSLVNLQRTAHMD